MKSQDEIINELIELQSQLEKFDNIKVDFDKDHSDEVINSVVLARILNKTIKKINQH
jgi:hypothetical protein